MVRRKAKSQLSDRSQSPAGAGRRSDRREAEEDTKTRPALTRPSPPDRWAGDLVPTRCRNRGAWPCWPHGRGPPRMMQAGVHGPGPSPRVRGAARDGTAPPRRPSRARRRCRIRIGPGRSGPARTARRRLVIVSSTKMSRRPAARRTDEPRSSKFERVSRCGFGTRTVRMGVSPIAGSAKHSWQVKLERHRNGPLRRSRSPRMARRCNKMARRKLKGAQNTYRKRPTGSIETPTAPSSVRNDQREVSGVIRALVRTD